MATTARRNNKTAPPPPAPPTPAAGAIAVRLTVREFNTPPVHDALVLGKRSPIGCVAMRKALGLMQTSPFAHVEFDDDTISDILVRETIVRMIPREALIKLVVQRIKPLMTDTDIIHLDIAAQLHLEADI